MRESETISGCLDPFIRKLPALDMGWQMIENCARQGFGLPGTGSMDYEDYINSYQQFEEWLSSLVEDEPLPKPIVALHFGVFESEDGLELYIAGSDECSDIRTGDWAHEVDFFPQGRFASLDVYRDLSALREENEDAAIALALALPIVYCAQFCASEQNVDQLLRRKGLFSSRRDSLLLGTGLDEDEELYYPFAHLTAEGLRPLAAEELEELLEDED